MTDEWIWVPRWDGPDGFQHYRDRDPIWIKNYTRLLSDDAYVALSLPSRGLLHGIWVAYAVSARRLPGNTLVLSRRLGCQVKRQTLEALVHAGFIEIIASDVLATRLQDASPHARPRARERHIDQKEVEELSVGESSSSNRSDETRTPRASPNGRAATSQLETLKAYVHRVWDDYPDKGVLADELSDRNLTFDAIVKIIDSEREART